MKLEHPDIYTNILDNRAVDVATANTKSSQIETVSHTGVSGAVVDNRVFVRSARYPVIALMLVQNLMFG